MPGAPVPALQAIRAQALSGPGGTLWEQTSLVRASRGRRLVNLANTAPLLHPRNIVLMHDAQVFDSPASYSAAFRAWYRLMQPRVARRARALMSVSAFSAARLAAHGIGREGNTGVVHNGLDHILRAPADTGALQRLGLLPGQYALGFASAQCHKNTALLLDAWRDPRLSAITLALVGKDLPDGTAPGANVRLLGPLDDASLRALYAGCLVFLFPSTTEGFGLPPGEAMLCGAPTVVSDAGALPEIYEGAARLLPHDAPHVWAEAVLELKADPEVRRALAKAGEARASTLTWERAATHLLERVRAC